MTPAVEHEGDAERRRVADELASRLRRSGVRLTGRESGEEIAQITEAVERFEAAVIRSGGDLMVDAPIADESPIAPDNSAFVLPRREDGESVEDYLVRLDAATTAARRAAR
jgi:chromosome condensin MukBEF MukE localization factor